MQDRPRYGRDDESEYQSAQDVADEKEVKVPQSAILGAACCAVIGGALGWLAGLGILTIQEVDSFASTSPILGIVAGAVMGGMVGCIGGWLAAIRTPDLDGERKENPSRAKASWQQISREDMAPSRSAILHVVDPSPTEIPAPDRR